MADAPFQLTIHIPGKNGRSFPLEPGTYTMGSDRGNQIILPGEEISWRHALLNLSGTGCYIEDLGSDTGTIVDGQRITSRYSLQNGSSIACGSYRMDLEISIPIISAKPVEPKPAAAQPPPPPPPTAAPKNVFEKKQKIQIQLKKQIHDELLKRLDIKRLTANKIDEQDLKKRTREAIASIIDDVRDRLPADVNAEQLAKSVFDEAVGLGPLEDLLADDSITEIMVNGANSIYIERKGKLEQLNQCFLSDHSVMAIIERIVAPIGRRIDESQPYVDARLPDGSRVNAIISPLSLVGPCLTVRKFSRRALTVADLVGFGTIDARIADFIRACVLLRKNMVVSGGTGSGKTTMLNVISNYLPETERIITIEDSAELRLVQDHVVRQESRPPNIEGKGAITIRDLVRNALRMRPDRIVVGECRGGEALDMLQAMNTGHEGSLTTVHANSPRDVISRLETMVLMSGMELPIRAIREQIGSAVHLVIHTSRFADGSRKLSKISEIVGIEGDRITMQDLFEYRQSNIDADGIVHGQFTCTGNVPTFLEEMQSRNIEIDRNIFDPRAWSTQ